MDRQSLFPDLVAKVEKPPKKLNQLNPILGDVPLKQNEEFKVIQVGEDEVSLDKI